jgi:hypothetical protein
MVKSECSLAGVVGESTGVIGEFTGVGVWFCRAGGVAPSLGDDVGLRTGR